MKRALGPMIAPLLLSITVSAWTASAGAATVYLQDIIAAPTAVNDFESAPGGLIGDSWSQQGIRATQVNGELNDIWTTSGFGQGQRSWYPDGGDDGWTRLTLDNGQNFDALSFFGGAGILAAQTLYFELFDDGNLVLSGTRDSSFFGSWFGFAGGDFDEVRLRARDGLVTSMNDCLFPPPGNRCNYLWLDDVKIGAASLPEPGSVALVPMALLGLVALRRRHRHAHAPGRLQ